MGHRVLGGKRDRLAGRLLGLVEEPPLGGYQGDHGVGPAELGGKLDRFLEFGKGLLEVLLLELCESERVVGAGMVRIELHRFLEMRNRRVPVLPLQGDPAFQVVPLRELGLFADEGVGFLFRRAGVLLVHGHARQEDAGRDFLGAHVQDVSIGRFGLGAIPLGACEAGLGIEGPRRLGIGGEGLLDPASGGVDLLLPHIDDREGQKSILGFRVDRDRPREDLSGGGDVLARQGKASRHDERLDIVRLLLESGLDGRLRFVNLPQAGQGAGPLGSQVSPGRIELDRLPERRRRIVHLVELDVREAKLFVAVYETGIALKGVLELDDRRAEVLLRDVRHPLLVRRVPDRPRLAGTGRDSRENEQKREGDPRAPRDQRSASLFTNSRQTRHCFHPPKIIARFLCVG